MNTQSTTPEYRLAEFAAKLQLEHVPSQVVRRAEDLFLDWFASTLAGKGSRPVEAITDVVLAQFGQQGASEIPTRRVKSSAMAAAMINAAASHVAEQDDVHNGSVFHPGAVVFPVALALAQDLRKSGAELLQAAIAGYETGIRVGEFLGRSHYKTFHTTGTAGSVAAAVTAGRLLDLSTESMLDAIGSGGTQSAGLWEFLKDAADSKQLHTAHAAATGTFAALLAERGFTGARRILTGRQGMAAGMSTDADSEKLTNDLGSRWALAETSFKFHASCRHTHPAADALQQVLANDAVDPEEIAGVTAQVHQGAIDVLGAVDEPTTVHQSKFSMGTVLGLIAVKGRASLDAFDDFYLDPAVVAFRRKVTMALDPEVDAAYPGQWIGKVTVLTHDGRTLTGRVDEPKGDPGNTLSRAEIELKAQQLARYRQGATESELDSVISFAWNLQSIPEVGQILK